MDALDHPTQAQQAVRGNRPHLRFEEQPGLGAGMIGRHAIGAQDAFGQYSDLLDRSQHTDKISYRIL